MNYLIVWNDERFANLRDAATEAVRLGMREFRVDLDKRSQNVPFITETAVALLRDLEIEFGKPKRHYPENKEGREP